MENGRKSKTYFVLHNINKSIYYKGLKPDQAFLIAMITFITCTILKLYSIIILLGLPYLLKKIRMENKKGNPDFVDDLWVSLSAKDEIVDDTYCMKTLGRE